MDRQDFEKLAERLLNTNLEAKLTAAELGFDEESEELVAGLNEWCEVYQCDQCSFWLPGDQIDNNVKCYECLDANRHG